MIGRTLILLPGYLLLAGLSLQPAHADDTLPGRLFFTPAERRALEYAHHHPAPENTDTMTTPPEVIRFDGMVWRKKQLVDFWINRKSGSADMGLRPDPDTGRLHLTDQDGQLVKLHAGQHWPPSIIDDSVRPVRLKRSQGDAGQ